MDLGGKEGGTIQPLTLNNSWTSSLSLSIDCKMKARRVRSEGLCISP